MIVSVIAIAAGFTLLEPDSVPRESVQAATPREISSPAPAARCRARAAIRFYAGRYREHVARMEHVADARRIRAKPGACPSYLARLWRAKAYAMRRYVERWIAHEYGWRAWLPANWRALGACETGYGREPGDWTWDSGTYVSAFGIYRPGYADDAHRIGDLSWDETKARYGRVPTPRRQYEAALSHYRTHGDGWGCPGP